MPSAGHGFAPSRAPDAPHGRIPLGFAHVVPSLKAKLFAALFPLGRPVSVVTALSV
jgi:hypothetical protein